MKKFVTNILTATIALSMVLSFASCEQKKTKKDKHDKDTKSEESEKDHIEIIFDEPSLPANETTQQASSETQTVTETTAAETTAAETEVVTLSNEELLEDYYQNTIIPTEGLAPSELTFSNLPRTNWTNVSGDQRLSAGINTLSGVNGVFSHKISDYDKDGNSEMFTFALYECPTNDPNMTTVYRLKICLYTVNNGTVTESDRINYEPYKFSNDWYTKLDGMDIFSCCLTSSPEYNVQYEFYLNESESMESVILFVPASTNGFNGDGGYESLVEFTAKDGKINYIKADTGDGWGSCDFTVTSYVFIDGVEDSSKTTSSEPDTYFPTIEYDLEHRTMFAYAGLETTVYPWSTSDQTGTLQFTSWNN